MYNTKGEIIYKVTEVRQEQRLLGRNIKLLKSDGEREEKKKSRN
jgi:hypothetical protein